MAKDSKHLFLIFGLFTLLSCLIFWPVFLGKVNLNGNLLVSFYAPYGQNLPFKNTGWDQLRIYFPFYRVTLDAMRHGQFALWSPWAFSGHPHLADFQSAVLYPLNVFGFFLPQIEFWHLLRITPTILGSFFMYMYLRNQKLSDIAAIFGAIIFGFSPFILTWGEEVVMSVHSIIWLPLILFAIDRYLASTAKKFLVVIALSVGASLFGGYMQTSIYLLIFVFSYLIFRFWEVFSVHLRGVHGRVLAHIGGVTRILGSIALGMGLAAAQLFPSAQLFFMSARSSINLKQTLYDFLLPLRSLLTYLVPDFFGHPATGNFFRGGAAQYYEGILFVGVAVLIFALFAIFWARNRLVIFMSVIGVIALSSTLNLPTSRLFLSLPIPFLSTSIANRILFVPALCLAVIGAIGFEKWLFAGGRKIIWVIGLMGVVYFALAAYVFGARYFGLPFYEVAKFMPQANALVALHNMAIPAGVFLISAGLIVCGVLRPKWRQKAAILIIVIACLQIFYFATKYFSFTDRGNVFPASPILSFIGDHQGIYRTWGVGRAAVEDNFLSQYSIYSPDGYDSLNNRSYGEFTYAMQGNMLSDYMFRADAGIGLGDAASLLDNPNRRKLIDLVGIKYVVGDLKDSQVLENNNYIKVFESGKYGVFENKQVIPRAFLASNYEGPPDVMFPDKMPNDVREKERRKLLIGKLLSDDFRFREELILEKPSPISAQFGLGDVQVISYKPQEVIIKTKSDVPKLLFLSDNYYPGWRATVDSDQTEILRADYTFRAVSLTAGEHTVRFYFDSDAFKLGLFISGLSLVTLLFLLKSRQI